MKVGDTVSIGYDCNVEDDFNGESFGENFYYGRKAIIVETDDGRVLRGALRGMRLFFRTKNKMADMWNSTSWKPTSCRMVLTEKTIIPLQIADGNKMLDYIHNYHMS